MPVIVSGLNELPGSGHRFYVLDDMDRARTIAAERQLQARQTQLGSMSKVTPPPRKPFRVDERTGVKTST